MQTHNNIDWSHRKGSSNGPGKWKNLCADFADCGGKMQSPINIEKQKVINDKLLALPKFNYGAAKVEIVNTGHMIQFNIDGEHSVELDDKTYRLLQFHYHAKSEHTIDGHQFPLEMHFVHKYSDIDFAVLGIMFVEGQENVLLSRFLKYFPKEKGEYISEDTIDLLSLFPENKAFYHYDGSLTTPPCSEVIKWYVLKSPLQASKTQLERFSAILNNNSRPIMPTNGRKVYVSVQQ